jgi:TPR repeat protein
VKWYTLAAEQGRASAQYNLGAVYGKGQGVPQDDIYAHMWGNIASSNGDEDGGKLRDIAAEQMTPSQIEKAQKLARECVAKNYKGC